MLQQNVKISFFMLTETVSLILHVVGISTDYLKAQVNEKSPQNF